MAAWRINFLRGVLWSFLFSVSAVAEDEAAPSAKAQYVELSPSFVTNFGAPSSKLNYIKADISLRVLSDEAAGSIKEHGPLVRHQIVMLLSSQSEQALAEPNSQEAIRVAALDAVQTALKEETGAPQVDDLLFTSFVVQR